MPCGPQVTHSVGASSSPCSRLALARGKCKGPFRRLCMPGLEGRARGCASDGGGVTHVPTAFLPGWALSWVKYRCDHCYTHASRHALPVGRSRNSTGCRRQLHTSPAPQVHSFIIKLRVCALRGGLIRTIAKNLIQSCTRMYVCSLNDCRANGSKDENVLCGVKSGIHRHDDDDDDVCSRRSSQS